MVENDQMLGKFERHHVSSRRFAAGDLRSMMSRSPNRSPQLTLTDKVSVCGQSIRLQFGLESAAGEPKLELQTGAEAETNIFTSLAGIARK